MGAPIGGRGGLLGTLLPRSIGTRLLLAFLGMSAITALLGAWGIYRVESLGRIDAAIFDRPLAALDDAREAGTVFEQLDNDQFWDGIPSLLGKGGPDPRERLLRTLDKASAHAASPGAIAAVFRVRVVAVAWLALRRANAPDAVLDPLGVEVRRALDALIGQTAEDGRAGRRQATEAANAALALSGALTIGAVGLSLLLSVLLSRQIIRPLRAAASVADRIAEGKFETPIPAGHRDEAGILLSSMAAMQGRIRDMVEAESKRRRSAQGRLIEALESSTEAMLLLDREGKIIVANSRVGEFLAALGARIKEGADFIDAFPKDDSGWAERVSTPGELMLPNGSWLSISREETVDGGSFLILSEITLRKSYERKLEAAAYEDPLTGINNRTYLLDRLDQELGDAEKPTHGVMFVANVDRFRQINNAHGQLVGDIVLVALATRLAAVTAPADICARIGGDEFVVWFRHVAPAERDALISRLQASLTLPIPVGEHMLAPRLSAGLAYAGTDRAPGHDLLRDARAALDKARVAGGNRMEVFDDALRAESRIRQRIERELDGAIRNREIHLEYQPLVDLASGRLSGFEALARWRHAEIGPIPPMRFIPIAEETGAIVALGEFVLQEAANQADLWARNHELGGNLTIAVNLSPRQIADPRNARRILDYFDRHEVAASRIKLEITEGVLLADPVAMLDLLKEFKARGVELSLDDFGTGYSSLSYLHKFPFDVLKIDRSFVTGLAESAETRRLVRTIIELGQDLGLRIVAEGVETREQAEHLKALGCNLGQGFYFSRPLDPARATEMLGMARLWPLSNC